MTRRDQGLFFGGQTLSLIGDNALWLAVGIWTKELTGSSGAAALTFFFFAAPALLAPLYGWVGDKLPKRPTLVAANLGAGATVMLLGLVRGPEDVWIIYAVMFGYGMFGGLIGGSQSALIAMLYDGDDLARVNSFLRTVREGLRVVGPLLGAGLFALLGGVPVAMIDAATFVAAAVSLLLLQVGDDPARPASAGFVAEISDGFRHLLSTLQQRRVVSTSVVAMTAIGLLEAILFAVVEHGLGRPPAFLGVLVAVQGAGSIAIGPLVPRLVRRFGEPRLTGVSFVFFAVGNIGLATNSLPVVLASCFAIGVGVPMLIVSGMTLIQRNTPMDLQSRVYTAWDMLLTVPQTFAIAVGALLISSVGRIWLSGAASAALATCATVLLRTEPSPHRDRDQVAAGIALAGADEPTP